MGLRRNFPLAFGHIIKNFSFRYEKSCLSTRLYEKESLFGSEYFQFGLAKGFFFRKEFVKVWNKRERKFNDKNKKRWCVHS